jgi:hypothetical protein
MDILHGMKRIKAFIALSLSVVYLAGPAAVFAADKADSKAQGKAKVKPYTLKTCAVSDEKLGGDMGDPYVFTHEGREIKLCCKSCLKDFKKDPAKYIKKIEKEEKKHSK